MENVAIIREHLKSGISIQSGKTIKKYIIRINTTFFDLACINTNEFHA